MSNTAATATTLNPYKNNYKTFKPERQPMPAKDEIAGYECKHVVYCAPPQYGQADLHVIKEIVHTTTGKHIPRMRCVPNYQRSFWVTQKGRQDHQEKKEWEHVDRLIEYRSTQSKLLDTAARALEQPWYRGDMRRLARSPYLYGTDINSTALIKQGYQAKFPTLITPAKLAVFDTEKDVVNGTKQIIIAALTCREKVFIAVQQSFVDGITDPANKAHVMYKKYLGEYAEKRNHQVEIKIVPTDADIIVECFQRAHEWMPDILAIWNINFDMPLMLETLARHNIDPKDIFSDPLIPPQYRHFRYKVGPNQKRMSSGKVMTIKPSAQWHTVFCPASFYFIDAMCAYRHVRTGQGEEPSYALDNILEKILGIRKLRFEAADHLNKIDWHAFMQKNYPLEYIIYCAFDCISIEELDEKTKDLQLSLPMLAGASDYADFKSQPKMSADALHFHMQSINRRMGTTSDAMLNEMDDKTVSPEGWIVTLRPQLTIANGMQIIKEDPDHWTKIFGQVWDLDATASYPNGGMVFNIAKETTKFEIISIEGISEETQRVMGIQLSGGHVNALEFCNAGFNMVDLETMLEAFEEELALEAA